MNIMGRMVNRLSRRLDSLLSAENNALEAIEEAERKARGIRASIPGEVSAIEVEYEDELARYESKSIEKVETELVELKQNLQGSLNDRKTSLETASSILGPRALELLHAAVEGERG